MAKQRQQDRFYRVRGDSGQRRRIKIVAAVLGVAAFLPLLARLYGLMVTDYDYYAKLALDNQTRITNVSTQRGMIYDRNMNILATTRDVQTIYLDPHELKQSKADLEGISAFLASARSLGIEPVRSPLATSTLSMGLPALIASETEFLPKIISLSL